MKTTLTQTSRRQETGYTLIELLVVITIMALLSTVVSLTWRSSEACSGSSEALASAFNTARALAGMKQAMTCVILDTDPADQGTANYLHRYTVAQLVLNDFEGTGWSPLPVEGVYINPNFLKSHGKLSTFVLPNGATATFNGAPAPNDDIFVFLPNGKTDNRAMGYTTTVPQVIVSPGSFTNGVFSEHGTTQRYGFVLPTIGRPVFIENLSDIEQ